MTVVGEAAVGSPVDRLKRCRFDTGPAHHWTVPRGFHNLGAAQCNMSAMELQAF
jgi:hypothetical protein